MREVPFHNFITLASLAKVLLDVQIDNQSLIRDHKNIDQAGQISSAYLMHTAIMETAAKAKDTGSISPRFQVLRAATLIATYRFREKEALLLV